MSLLDDEKTFYSRFWCLHNDAELVSVFKQFGPEPFRRSSVLEGLGEFCAEHKFAGKRVVEIGSWMGLTAVVLSRFFAEVVSIDIHPNPQKHAIIDFLGIKNVQFIDVKDNAEKEWTIAGLRFDAAFSDGDHAKDAEEDFRLVARCGHVLMHEYWEAQPPVWNLVNRLKARGGSRVITSGKWALWDGGG